MRRLTEPMQLGGYTIPPDTIVAPCVYLMHRRATCTRNTQLPA